MYCKYCGTENKRDARFCENCGKTLMGNDTPKFDTKKLLMVILIIGVIALTIILVGGEVKDKSSSSKDDGTTNSVVLGDENNIKIKNPNKVGNSSQNINEEGYIAYQDGWFYYYNGMGLYKIKEDGTERALLYSGEIDSINVVGEWIFYDSNVKGESGFYKIKIDGTERQSLHINGGEYINVIDDWIYYACYSSDESKTGLYRAKLDGSKNEMIVNGSVSDINIVGEWIYYFLDYADDSNGIYKVNIDGSKNQLLYTEDYFTVHNYDIDKMIVENDWIYFKKTSSIVYKLKTDGTMLQAYLDMDDDNNGFFNSFSIHEGSVYYTFIYYDDVGVEAEAALCEMNKQGDIRVVEYIDSVGGRKRYYLDKYVIDCKIDSSTEVYTYTIYDESGNLIIIE